MSSTTFLALGGVTAIAFGLVALHHITAAMLDAIADTDPETQDDFTLSMARWGHVQNARNGGGDE